MVLPHMGLPCLGTYLRHELQHLLLGLGFGHGRGAHLVGQAALAVRALVPGVHQVQLGVALVDGEHRALDARLQVGPVTTTAISMMRSTSGSRPVISQSSQTRFWSLFPKGGAEGCAAIVSAIRAIVADGLNSGWMPLSFPWTLAFAAFLLAGLGVKFWLATRQVRTSRATATPCRPVRRHRLAGRAPEGRRLHRRQVARRPARDGFGAAVLLGWTCWAA
jgi:hypothetical protein